MFKRFEKDISKPWQELKQLQGTPHAVALGVAAGMYIGFFPLIGLKTLLALGLAWILRGNRIAAVVGVTLHDISIPIAPFLMRLEYDIGYWLLSKPHHFPAGLDHPSHQTLAHYANWKTMLSSGEPLLLGSALLGIPVSVILYYVMFGIVKARQSAHATPSATND